MKNNSINKLFNFLWRELNNNARMILQNMITNHQQKSITWDESPTGVKFFHSLQPFRFENGETITPLTLAFETYGELTPAKDNVILIHHALSTSSHVAAHEKNSEKGWWEAVVGPDKAIDTKHYFVICINNLGSCFGSSGPASMNPKTKKTYQADFPAVTIADMVHTQYLLLQALGIEKLYAVVGNSMGAMMSLTWAILYPDVVQKLISVSSCYKSYPVSIATHIVQKEIIAMDPEWKNGYYEKIPMQGFSIARKYALLSYRNPNELNARFSSQDGLLTYLDYNAKKFITTFDVNSYLYIFEAMDRFDVTRGYQDPLEPFRKIRAQSLIISVSSDLLFPPQQQRDLYEMLQQANVPATFIEHISDYGHDAFYADKTIISHIEKFLS